MAHFASRTTSTAATRTAGTVQYSLDRLPFAVPDLFFVVDIETTFLSRMTETGNCPGRNTPGPAKENTRNCQNVNKSYREAKSPGRFITGQGFFCGCGDRI
ncbi:hypothetical protein GCM10009589_37240 [Arthrobacter pascens]